MYMLIPMDFITLGKYVYVESVRFYKLVNYVYADSTEVLNACKLCI